MGFALLAGGFFIGSFVAYGRYEACYTAAHYWSEQDTKIREFSSEHSSASEFTYHGINASNDAPSLESFVDILSLEHLIHKNVNLCLGINE